MTPRQRNTKIRNEYRTRHPEYVRYEVIITYTCTGPDADTINGHIVRVVDKKYSTIDQETVTY